MYFNSKIQLNSIQWIWLILFSLLNLKFVRSVIVHQQITNSSCQIINYLKDQMYQCELTLYTTETSERIILNFNRLEINCTDTLYIYDGPNTLGEPTYKLTCDNKTGSVIYSTNNSLSLEYVTADDLGFNSKDFYLVYTSFNDSSNGCDGFVCQDENKYCIFRESECDGYFHCGDGSDERDCRLSYDEDGGGRIKLIALICFASCIVLLGIIWLCAHTRKVMRNRAVIQRNGVTNN